MKTDWSKIESYEAGLDDASLKLHDANEDRLANLHRKTAWNSQLDSGLNEKTAKPRKGI